MTTTTITGPAVRFDPDTLRAWLADSVVGFATRADELGIGDLFGRAHGTLLGGLKDLLSWLQDDPGQTAWTTAAGISYIQVFGIYDGEGCDGALITVDIMNGVWLASLYQDHKDFASLDSVGADAAVEALTNVAYEVNAIVQRYRDASGAEVRAQPATPQ